MTGRNVRSATASALRLWGPVTIAAAGLLIGVLVTFPTGKNALAAVFVMALAALIAVRWPAHYLTLLVAFSPVLMSFGRTVHLEEYQFTTFTFRITVVELAALGFLLSTLLRSGWRGMRFHGLPWVLAWAVVVVASALFADRTGVSIWHLIRFLTVGLLGMAILIHANREPGSTRFIARGLALTGGLYSAYGVFQFFTGQAFDFTLMTWVPVRSDFVFQSSIRSPSVFTHPNLFGAFLDGVLPLAFGFFLRSSGLARWAWFGIFMIDLAGLATTLSRGAWVACAAGILVTYAAHRGIRKASALAVTLGLGLAIVLSWYAPGDFMSRLSTATTLNFSSNEIRFVLWKGTWENLVTPKPLLGIGLGHYEFTYPSAIASVPPDLTHANNTYMQVLAELGLAGLILMIVYVATTLTRLVRRVTGTSDQQDVDIGLLGTVAGLALHSLFDYFLFVDTLLVFISVLGALVLVRTMPNENDDWRTTVAEGRS